MKSANLRQVTERDEAMENLSKRQKHALAMALWMENKSDRTNHVFARRIKQLLLRAFVIYQHRQQLLPDQLNKYHLDYKNRLKRCLDIMPESRICWQGDRFNIKIPFYLLLFLEEIFTVYPNIEDEKSLESNNISQPSQSVADKSNYTKFGFDYYIIWGKFVEWLIDISGKKSIIVELKKNLGYISLIPISVGGKNVKIRGIGINYHDLYHLEVAQLNRIQIGKNWVSGIHGINAGIFHDLPIVEEYDGYLDEARVAIHEGLTRPTAFSVLKTFCWLILLSLHGINSLAVLIRHLKSLKTKQEDLINAIAL
ncbi:MAG: hypothetical protein KME28_14520 [Pelatocladus maniniholoensis HA4357-MV3]|jgi:hypothetical protein|uniref:Uncharacterized protein n=1 Tax=Pelatocladus maniniholoensis HA4357-MV3 TaxID=1117104 RepID=A0A9E3LUD2_9NOST|nr:hypothetical protein [Pelatocladus maniniholoensis HA4357-MV3]BAZ67671.1 hypothetical protein NIES4106_24260 [Fischerella sp. NIES-4106]